MCNQVPILSIVVPIYNVERFLERCINSILSQSFSNFELLLINDGSTDNSGVICDKFSLLDSRVSVHHKENGGVSSARNLGIFFAKGEWVIFIDSDDWIDNNYISSFFRYEHIQKNSIVIQGLLFCDEKNHCFNKFQFIEKVYVDNQLGKCFVENELLLFGAPYCKLYNLSVIRKNNLCFPINISYGEDTLFFLEYYSIISNVYFSHNCGYHYLCTSSVTLSTKNHPPEMLYNFFSNQFKLIQLLIGKYNITDSSFLTKFYMGQADIMLRSIANMNRLNYSYKDRANYLINLREGYKDKLDAFNNIPFCRIILLKIIGSFPIILIDLFFGITFRVKDSIAKARYSIKLK